MTVMLDFPAALESAGVTVRLLDGWDNPHIKKDGPYVWRESNNAPAGHMHHHTASGRYDPNREKANGYAGLSYEGSSVLYQEQYNEGDYQPIYTIANAYPAPISSGAGDLSVLERVRQGVEVVGRQGRDTPGYYGNTHYWNTEWVCRGDGSPIDAATWDMMLVVCQVQNDLMDWTPNMHISHGHHTRRKIDLWDGTYGDSIWTGFDDSIEALRTQMKIEKEGGMPPFDIWIDYIRIVDIEKMGSDHIITDTEVKYFTTPPMWDVDVDRAGDVNMTDWHNLYNSYRTRAPIWAV